MGNATARAYGQRSRGDDGTITNRGEITARAAATAAEGTAEADAWGIYASDSYSDAVIVNSGKITSGAWENGTATTAYSIYTDASGNSELQLNAPSYLGGAIFAGSDVKTTLTTGASHSILWNVEDIANLTVNDSLVPVFFDGATLAESTLITTFDPTVFAASSSQLADRSAVLGSVIRGRLDARGEGCFSCGGVAHRLATIWAAGFGRHMDYDGHEGVVDHEVNHYSGVVGFDWTNGSGLTLGAMTGYGGESMDASSPWTSSWENTAQGLFAGFYGRNQVGVGAAVSVNIEARDWTITPRIGGRYGLERIDGYTETGGGAGTNAVVGSQDVEVAEGRIELALSRLVRENVRFTGRGGYLARRSTGDDHVEVTLFDTTRNVSTWADDPASFYTGGNMVVALPGSAILQIGGQVFFGGDGMSGYEGTASLGGRF